MHVFDSNAKYPNKLALKLSTL